MALGGAHAPGATPLDQDELVDLIPTQIATQRELNEWEQKNIIQGQEWALGTRRSRFPSIVTDAFIRDLHRKMFDQTWKWAGTYRTSGLIGRKSQNTSEWLVMTLNTGSKTGNI
jgi:fido (protein-threonine AMPylation protein)